MPWINHPAGGPVSLRRWLAFKWSEICYRRHWKWHARWQRHEHFALTGEWPDDDGVPF